MLTRRTRALRTVLVAVDLLVVATAFAAAYLTRNLAVFDRFGELYSARSYLWALWAALPIWSFSLRQAGFYHKLRSTGYRDLSYRLGKAALMVTVSLAAVLYLTKGVIVSRLFVQIFVVYSFGLLFASRVVLEHVDRVLRRRPGWARQTLLVGRQDQLSGLVAMLRSNEAWTGELVGALTWEQSTQNEVRTAALTMLGSREVLGDVLRRHVVDEVVFAQPGPHYATALEEDLQLCESQGVTARVVLSFGPIGVRSRKVLEAFDEEHAVVSFESVPGDIAALAIKRSIDIVAGVVGLAFCGAALLIVARRIKRESPGPVLFAQERVGLNGRPFRLYKIRTMVADAETQLDQLRAHNEMRGAMFKMARDPRVTRFGARLRHTHIDELPQFFNVLRGEMSLVGTRPPTPDEVRQYAPHHHRRISFKPGLTGLWQVRGNREVPDFEDVVRMDTEYIERWSLWLDAKILVMTLRKVYRELFSAMPEDALDVARSDSAET